MRGRAPRAVLQAVVRPSLHTRSIGMNRNTLPRAVGTMLVAAAAMTGLLAGAGGPAQAAEGARQAQVNEVARTVQAGKVQPVEWHGERKGCKVNVYAKARL